MKDSTLSDAEHAVFQEPISGTTQVSSLVEHEIYFRVKGDPLIRRLQPENCDDLVLHSMKERMSTSVEHTFVEGTHTTAEQISTTVEQPYFEEISTTVGQEGTSTTVGHTLTENNEQIPTHLPEPKRGTPPYTPTSPYQQSSVIVPSESFDQRPSEKVSSLPFSQSELQANQLLDEAASFKDIVKLLKHSKNKGKVEFFHVFRVGSCHRMNDILQIFVKNVSLCTLVTDSSEAIVHKEEVEMLHGMSYASKAMVIEMCGGDEPSPEHLASKSTSLQHVSNILVESSSKPLNYIFPITLTEQGDSGNDIGTCLLSHALSSSSTKTFPFSWYLFGFRLRLFMISRNQSTATVSNECMAIAKGLEMNRPTVEAALEHLMNHNIILYFRNILSDAVFLDVQIFSLILDQLFEKSSEHGSFDVSVFDEIITNLHKSNVPHNNLFALFIELMIIAPYDNNSYFVPSWLSLLDEKDRKEKCSAAFDSHFSPLFCKCPSTGYQFITMLTAFLLNLPDGWSILRSSQHDPACLYKNCVKFNLEDRCAVTVSFFSEYIEVYVKLLQQKTVQNLHNISNTILRGLEKVKLLLNSYPSNSFDMAFPCHCERFEHVHTAPYNSDTGTLECDGRSVEIYSTSPIMKWLRGNKSGMPHFFHLLRREVSKN
jgi:hypothetical protein